MTMTTTVAAVAEERAYFLRNFDSDVDHLRHLICATYDILNGMDYGVGATRNHELDRVAALTGIARDLAEKLVARLEARV